jgi:lipoprotein-anchoring transpeptidase ErfK/SrfK
MNQNNSNENKRKKNNLAEKILFFGAMGSVAALIIMYLGLSFYFNKHFFSNTYINGVNTSGMTEKQAEEAINAEVKAYTLTMDGRNGVSDTIYGEDINLHTVYDESLPDLLTKQNGFIWPVSLFKTSELKIKTMIEYDEALLKKQFNGLDYFKEENNIEPVNAKISDYGDNGYEIIKEEAGAKIKEDKLYGAIKKSVASLETFLSLEESDCYEEPKLTSQSTELLQALEKMNTIAGAQIIYTFGDNKEVLDGNRISEWLTLDKNFKVKLNTDGIKEYVDYIGKTYNSFGRVRTFKTTYGKTLEIKGGDYGWWLDRASETKELTELVKNGEKVNRDPIYYQTAQQYGDDDIGDTYVEINLTAQHLFFYKDGKQILETDFVSGNISKGNGTPVGTYPIQYKEREATLTGEDYSTPVEYWMPFNRNIGLHDAPWRSAFGGDIYLTSGSHGCINMPPAKAKKLYENISKGVAVVVYELPGTETHDKDKDNTKVTSNN